MNRLQALVGLNLIGDIGSIRLSSLLGYFKNIEGIFTSSQKELSAVSGIGQKIAARITSIKKEEIDREFSRAHKLGLRIICEEDADYPFNLKNIPDPPIVLYVLGELKREDNLGLAIVGSRRASFYGLSNTEKFCADLSRRGFTIISGMARGIDTCAHRTSLKQHGRTIAVMGSGFNNIYPAENKALAQEISESGAVISEFPIDAQPLKEHFPQRNRLISGLALGVLVVEAARNSGALITADFALEQGREVFALPGKVDSGNSFGTNALIKQGAKLVDCVEDIIEEFDVAIQTNPKESDILAKQKLDLSDKESVLYELLSSKPVGLDEIIEKINMGIPDISGILLKLQLKNLIRQLPGKQFTRI
jgi:DNA processing protein